MARALRCLAAFFVCLMGLTALGCAKPAVQQPSPAPTATALQNAPQVQANQIDIADTLIGFVIPQSEDIALCTAMHGFLRTAENLGYPAKLYRAQMGAQSVAAVEQAVAEGCKGLLLWNPDGANAAAAEKAAALSIPVIVPYHDASGAGVTANVVADLMGYTEEIALSLAERMVERECKAGKILAYGRNPQPAYEKFTQSIAEYYPQFNVGYFVRTAEDEQAAIDELAEYILWNRDIKGLFSVDADGASVASRARAQAQSRFKKEGAPEAAASPIPAISAPSATPVPSGLIKSITISVAAYGISESNITLMRSEDIYAFVLEPYYEASAQSVMLLDRVMSGERVPAVSRLNMPIVRKVTLDKYAFIHNQVLDWFELKQS